MIAIPIIQSVIFIVYFIFIVKKYGVLESISDSWYQEGDINYLFILFLLGIGIPAILLLEPAFIVTGSLLCIVGALPMFRLNKFVGIAHGAATTGAIIAALVGLTIHGIWLPFVEGSVAALIINHKGFKIKNTTTWTEVVYFSAIEHGLFILKM